MSESVTLADVERLCWHLSGWQVDQRDVDQLLAAVQAYVATDHSGAAAPLAAGGTGAEETSQGAPEPSPDVSPQGDLPQAVPAPQAGVQRIEVTGTLTLVCAPAPRQRSEPRTPLRTTLDGVVPETVRECRKCHSTQPIDQFVRDSHGLRGRKRICRMCENKRKRDAERARKQAAAL